MQSDELDQLIKSTLQSRWDLARVRMLGMILRSPKGSLLRTVAVHLGSVSRNAKGEQRAMEWNWSEGLERLIKSVDDGTEAALQLGPHVNLRTMMPRVDGKDSVVPRAAVRAFTAVWRAQCRAAIGEEGGRDARVWRKQLRQKVGDMSMLGAGRVMRMWTCRRGRCVREMGRLWWALQLRLNTWRGWRTGNSGSGRTASRITCMAGQTPRAGHARSCTLVSVGGRRR